uniref:Uncharacterized protein n=1 Tax=Cannabis sativa TaxID=3483 RepID=A0A803QQX3_CANSA
MLSRKTLGSVWALEKCSRVNTYQFYVMTYGLHSARNFPFKATGKLEFGNENILDANSPYAICCGGERDMKKEHVVAFVALHQFLCQCPIIEDDSKDRKDDPKDDDLEDDKKDKEEEYYYEPNPIVAQMGEELVETKRKLANQEECSCQMDEGKGVMGEPTKKTAPTAPWSMNTSNQPLWKKKVVKAPGQDHPIDPQGRVAWNDRHGAQIQKKNVHGRINCPSNLLRTVISQMRDIHRILAVGELQRKRFDTLLDFLPRAQGLIHMEETYVRAYGVPPPPSTTVSSLTLAPKYSAQTIAPHKSVFTTPIVYGSSILGQTSTTTSFSSFGVA